MPHAGLMKERDMGPVEGPLLRARLHIRGGKRRLRQGKHEAGIVTLGDALSAAIEYALDLHSNEIPNQPFDYEQAAYDVLVSTGILSGRFDYDAFQCLVEDALAGSVDASALPARIAALDALMTELGIMPFDEAALPPENPDTF